MPFIRNENPAPFTPQEAWVSPELKARIEAMPRIMTGESTFSFDSAYTMMPPPPSTGNIVVAFEVFYGVRENP